MCSKINTRFISLCIVILIILTIFYKFGASLQYKLIYEPSRNMDWDPTMENKVEDIFIPVLDKNKRNVGRVNAWRIKNFPDSHQIILFCHGSKGNISQYKNIIDISNILELNIILFDYRGYGKSPGYVSQDRILEDGLAVYDYYSNTIDKKKLIIMGESLGGSVATYVASKRECSKLILISTFDSLSGIIGKLNQTSWINRVFSIFIKNFYFDLPVIDYIKKIEVPTLIIHSAEDNIIPIKCAENLFSALPSKEKKFIIIKGKHVEPIFTQLQIEEFIDFVGLDNTKFTKLDYYNLITYLRFRTIYN